MTANNRHINQLYCGDCKSVLKQLIEKGITVDLIYLDPPFNSNRVYNLIFKSDNTKNKSAQQIAFHDVWTPTAQTKFMFENFKETIDKETNIDQEVKDFLKAWMSALNTGSLHSRKLLNYLLYMTERLIPMKNILSDTGSIYLHCDPTASHYIKIIMDGIFGNDNFINEIVWCYSGTGRPKKNYKRKHDTILFYAKSKAYYIDVPKELPTNPLTIKRYNKTDSEGKVYKEWNTRGTIRKVYLKEEPINDWWEIPVIGATANERLGYPTQKPLTLLERIITSSCPEGGIVLDPFCGCGTAIDAAIKNRRHWIGMDISSFSIDIIEKRIRERHGFERDTDFTVEYDRPRSWDEYSKLNAFEKQDFLIRKIGGMPNPRKSGDGGIDGTLTVHTGRDENNKDTAGKIIFSVKTGKQVNPAMLRELQGTMQRENAVIGVLLLDSEPSPNMRNMAEESKKFRYYFTKDALPVEYDSLQIYTAMEILDGVKLESPPPMVKVQEYTKLQKELFYS